MTRFGGGRAGGKTAKQEAAAREALRAGDYVLFVGRDGSSVMSLDADGVSLLSTPLKPEPRFPDGPEVHLFDRYADAMAALPRGWDLPGSNIRAVTIATDPGADAMIGYRPARIVDHTTSLWPDTFRKVVEFRASWCGVAVERPADDAR